MHYIFLIMILMVFLFVPTVSAMELNPFADTTFSSKTITSDMPDFIKENFNSEYGVIRLSKTFFWFETDKIAEYSLTDNTKICSSDCEAIGKAILYSDGILFNDVQFRTLSGKNTSIISWKIQIYEGMKDNYVGVPDKYEEVCKTNISGTYCHNETITYRQENHPLEIWKDYDYRILSKGEYKWRITGNKSPLKTVDFIPIRNSNDFSEWAIWGNGYSYVYEKNGGTLGGTSSSGRDGIKIVMNKDFYGDLKITESDSGKYTTCHVLNAAFNTLYESPTITSHNCTLTGVNLTAGTTYYVGGNQSAANPYTTTLSLRNLPFFSNWTGGYYDTTGGTTVYNVEYLTWKYGAIGSNISLETPVDYYNSSNANIQFNCSATMVGATFANATLWTNKTGSWEISNSTTSNGNIMSAQFSDGMYKWGCQGCDSDGDCGWSIENRTLTVDTTLPSLTIKYPENTTYNINVSELNYTYSDTHPGYCWYSIDNGVTNSTSSSAGDNFTSVTSIEGSNTWKVYCNDSFGNINSSSVTFFKDSIYPLIDWGVGIAENGAFLNTNSIYLNTTWTEVNFKNITFNVFGMMSPEAFYDTPTYAHNFSITLDGFYEYNVTICDQFEHCNFTTTKNLTIDTVNPSISIISPTANQAFQMPPDNFTLKYLASDTNLQSCWYSLNGGANQIIADCNNVSIEIGNITSNSIVVYANDSAGNINSSSVNFKAYPTFKFCNDTIAMKAINFTFKDESTNTEINASVDASAWTYWHSSDTSYTQSFLFSNLTDNFEYDFCIYPNWSSVNTDVTFQYSHSEGTVYPQRQWQQVNYALDNSTNAIVLYLLPSSAGQYVTFQVVNSALSPISGVTIAATRTISGTPTTIETKVTDSSGAATMWLNPLYSHTITASKTGYITYSNSITPSSTSYTITLQETGSVNVTNYNAGINYSIAPLDNYLNQSTYYLFNFTISSSGTLNIDRFWYNITNNSGSIIISNYSSTDGGTLISNISTGLNKSFTMFAYYDVNGTILSTSKMWLIANSSGDEWSIKYLFNDLKSYTDTRIFGLDSFGVTLIVFLIIFLGSGIISYNFGLYSPAAVSGIIFAETFLFDGVLGLIKYPFGVTLPIATIVMALVFFGLAVKEGTSY